jgi:cytochrome c2
VKPVPESLRLVLALLGAGALAAVGSYGLQERQERLRLRDGAQALTGGSVDNGRQAIVSRRCTACHDIPGIDGPRGLAGPPLEGVAARATIAGLLRNDPDNLMKWIRTPQAVVPGNAMPDMGIDDAEARDIAAYLYTLRPATP